MYEILLALLAVFLIFLFPGLSLGRILRLPFANIWETLFYSISLSLAAIVGIGFVLGTTVGINQGSVLAAFLFVSIIGIASISLSLWNSLQRARNPWKIITAYSAKARSKVMLAGVAAVAVTAINWSSAIGTHPVDMGEHVFWAKVIMTTSRLPNYYS